MGQFTDPDPPSLVDQLEFSRRSYQSVYPGSIWTAPQESGSTEPPAAKAATSSRSPPSTAPPSGSWRCRRTPEPTASATSTPIRRAPSAGTAAGGRAGRTRRWNRAALPLLFSARTAAAALLRRQGACRLRQRLRLKLTTFAPGRSRCLDSISLPST